VRDRAPAAQQETGEATPWHQQLLEPATVQTLQARKLSPWKTTGSLTQGAARLHFTSEQFWMGKTDQNRAMTKKYNLP